MDAIQDNSPDRSGRVLDGMILLSTLLTAIGIRYDVAERQAGRDPSEEEAQHIARDYVTYARGELTELLLRLGVSSMVAASEETDSLALSVRRFDDLLTVAQIARLLHGIHQRLLSLYPSVQEDLIEDVRALTARARDLVDAPDRQFGREADLLIEQAFALGARLKEEVSE